MLLGLEGNFKYAEERIGERKIFLTERETSSTQSFAGPPGVRESGGVGSREVGLTRHVASGRLPFVASEFPRAPSGDSDNTPRNPPEFAGKLQSP